MADSDDEYDRRRRDKFRRERSDYDRSRERDDRRRDDWNERDWDRGRDRGRRTDYRDYDRGRRDRFSPPRRDMSPPQKRMRRDWDDHGEPFRGGYDIPYGGGPGYGPPLSWRNPEPHMMPQHHNPMQGRLGTAPETEAPMAFPVMKTFKEFLLSMADSVDETEAVRRYNAYKIDFRRQQLQEFFMSHKDEEWFRLKYHPEEAGKRKKEAAAVLQNRLKAFLFLLQHGWLDNVRLDPDKADSIVRFLDAAVIKMEGGLEVDLQSLDLPEEESRDILDGAKGSDVRKNSETAMDASPSSKAQKADSGVKAEKGEEQHKTKKRNRSQSQDKEKSDSEPEADDAKQSQNKIAVDNASSEGNGVYGGEKEKEDEVLARPRALHRTCSLFMRNIAPNIAKSEIIALCRQYPGFIRVALSEPQPDGRFYRRAWVTFERNVNIKEICWSLQNIRLRDCELSPVVNRDLARRVRSASTVTQHRPVVRNDIRLSAKLIQALDQKAQLWTGAQIGKDGDLVQAFSSQNPVLKNITDYLIEEVSAEEDELLGNTIQGDSEQDGNTDMPLERDEKLLKVLDRLILYLRIVHSVDYYNACEYPNEDEMPSRCGMIHVRGPASTGRITQNDVRDYEKQQEEKLAPLLSLKEVLTEEEAIKMGKKDQEQEVEKFVQANTQELSKDKWVCPLSGKKFKGPEFVRKHIFNKHSEKLEEVRREVAFFNNYLMDPKRPGPPEPKCNQPLGPCGPQTGMGPNMGYPNNPQPGMMGYHQPRPPMMGFGGGPFPPQFGGRGGFDPFRGQGGFPKPRGRGPRGDPRAIIEYRDLDAPDDIDFF
uniref:serrate RNA effector molecule homolog isoform X2 n=1 Tax=Myxine glutinosa TaxID=7769 RepID=UPI00358FDD07